MINNLTLQGRLTRDPETKTFGDNRVCNFTVAWSQKIGEREDTLFLNCSAWNSTADLVSKYFVKGQEIIIEATLKTEKYEKDGETKSSTKATVNRAHFCGKKGENTTSEKPKLSELKEIQATEQDLDLPF